MHPSQHRARVDKLEALVEHARNAVKTAQRALERHQRRLDAARAELAQLAREAWANTRMLELDRRGLGAGEIAAVLRQERGYVITYMAVYLRVQKLRQRAAESSLNENPAPVEVTHE